MGHGKLEPFCTKSIWYRKVDVSLVFELEPYSTKSIKYDMESLKSTFLSGSFCTKFSCYYMTPDVELYFVMPYSNMSG